MTENEAIKYMLSYKFGRGRKPRYSDDEIDEAFNVAITALKEIQQYREIGTVEYFKKLKLADNGTIWGFIDEYVAYKNIGTVEECREAAEKQKPKPCEFYGDEEDGKLLCPDCGEDLWELKECGFNNCPYCGQAVTL